MNSAVVLVSVAEKIHWLSTHAKVGSFAERVAWEWRDKGPKFPKRMSDKQIALLDKLVNEVMHPAPKPVPVEIEGPPPPPSKWVGMVGAKVEVEVEVVFKKNIVSYYGESVLHIMKDATGNEFKWFATSASLDKGTRYVVTGKVKKHDEYNGTKSTVLTRCKAVEVPGSAPAVKEAA